MNKKRQLYLEQSKKKAEFLVSKMTIKEIVSQLLYDSPAIQRLNINAYNWWNEGLHGAARSGTATVFPQAIGIASCYNPELIKQIAVTISSEQRAKYNMYSSLNDRGIYKGLTIWSPNVNIFRDPRWGRGQETYGEDPFLAKTLAVEFIKGLQGDDEVLKIAACVKHFVAHSGPEAIRHQFNATVSKKDLEETYLPAFKAAVEKADVNAVMGAYNAINNQACCASDLIESKLRAEYSFKGMFISDCWALRDIHEKHHITVNAEESAALALKKGCDLNCGCTYNFLEKAYKQKLVSRADLEKAAIRVFTTRYALSSIDSECKYDSILPSIIDCDKHQKINLKAAEQSIVMLENEDLLPLKNINTIAVVGPNADSSCALWGNYHGTASHYTTVLEGIKVEARKHKIRVLYSEGTKITTGTVERLATGDDRMAEAESFSKLSDLTILVLGLNETIEGEMHDDGNGGIAGDKNQLTLPLCQQRLLDRIVSTGKPFVLLLLSGGSIDPKLYKYANQKALLQCWYPGSQGGTAIANILFGNTNPSGRLPITFYKADTELPLFTDYSMKERTYKFFTKVPLYRFGYGLSYTTYFIRLIKRKDYDNNLVFQFEVQNTGNRLGVETILLYGKADSIDAPPNPILLGFTKIKLRPAELKECKIIVEKEEISLVNNEGERYTANCKWDFFVQGSNNKKLDKLVFNEENYNE